MFIDQLHTSAIYSPCTWAERSWSRWCFLTGALWEGIQHADVFGAETWWSRSV